MCIAWGFFETGELICDEPLGLSALNQYKAGILKIQERIGINSALFNLYCIFTQIPVRANRAVRDGEDNVLI